MELPTILLGEIWNPSFEHTGSDAYWTLRTSIEDLVSDFMTTKLILSHLMLSCAQLYYLQLENDLKMALQVVFGFGKVTFRYAFNIIRSERYFCNKL